MASGAASATRLRPPSVMSTLVLCVGPVATVALVGLLGHMGVLAAMPLHQYVYVALLFWSPLPFAVPAVMLEAHRDAVMPEARGLRRGGRALALLPAMLTRGSARLATLASLVGFAAAVAVVIASPALRV